MKNKNLLKAIQLRTAYTLVIILMLCEISACAQDTPFSKGELIYKNNFEKVADVKDWVMEGAAEVYFEESWMHMYSPNEESHHVFWCPQDFPDSIIVEMEVQNIEPDAGLCILFFAAKGVNGEDVLDPSLPERTGVFRQYTKSQLNSYHISYYANTPEKPDRGESHLRKNNEFALVQTGADGIPAASTKVHQLQLIKAGATIIMYVDGRKIIDWVDTLENDPRPYYSDGKIALRQMKWTHFKYRDFRVYKISSAN